MSTTTDTAPSSRPRSSGSRPVRHALAIAHRNLLTIARTPQLLVFATIQPVIFVLMFRYVFGGAITVPGTNYVNYLMPGIFVQTVVFGALTTGVGLAEDLHRGLIDRFRSLPMARSAVLVGRTLADLTRNLFVVILMAGIGVLVGWHNHGGAARLIGALLLVLAFAYSLSWVFALVGLSTPNAETAQAASFPLLAPLVFASSAFVPVSSMPSWLQGWANHQPVSVVINATRELTLGTPATDLPGAVGWIIGIIAVFAPLGIWRYRHVG
jgi:ABC transporter DrrB family efflux protein